MSKPIIGIVGLGYVGLPLACLFATKYKVIGYDIKDERINELKNGVDTTLEVDGKLLFEVVVEGLNGEQGLFLTSSFSELKRCNYYIVAVPTCVDEKNNPVLNSLLEASKVLGKCLKKEDIVIYESTVYPGATEEVCVPILERSSNLKYNRDFYVGYSPERVSPGVKTRTLENILKITSGSTKETASKIDNLYRSVLKKGTQLVSSIKVAEAAKIVENCQRDINIAFVNEMAKIFNLMNIDTHEVLEAAETKWNFLSFKPGLVGGHCIGTDPYYLTQKAKQYGYYPEVILSGRRLNDGMGVYVASEVIKLLIDKGINIKKANALILGFTFKEDCPDVRNTKVIDIYKKLRMFGLNTDVYDPIANKAYVKSHYEVDLIQQPLDNKYDVIVLAVSHNNFRLLEIEKLKRKGGVVYDVKNFLAHKDRTL